MVDSTVQRELRTFSITDGEETSNTYITFIDMLKQQFANSFTDVRTRSTDVMIFANPFELKVDDVPDSLQLEVIEMLC